MTNKGPNDFREQTETKQRTLVIVELQLKLIYCFEWLFTLIKNTIHSFGDRCLLKLRKFYTNSLWFTIAFNFKTYFFNNSVRRKKLLEWLHIKLKLQFRPTNFNTDWRDGIRLCALCDAMVPGVCPRYDLLNPSLASKNIRMALQLLNTHLNIKPNITEHEIYTCSNEAKLVHLLSLIKIAETKLLLKSRGSNFLQLNNRVFGRKQPKTCIGLPKLTNWFAKGMGLISGVRCRRSRFSIYYPTPLPKLNVVIEIVGPNGSFSSESILSDYNNSADEDENEFKNKGYDQIMQTLLMRAAMKKKDKDKNLKIPLFSERFSDRISITYIPFFAGQHTISIIWQGQHLFESPYNVSIEETEYLENEINDIGPKFIPGFQYPLCLLSSENNSDIDQMGTVIRRKVLKKTVVSNGEEHEFSDYFESKFSQNFLKNPNDDLVKEYRRRKTYSQRDAAASSSNSASQYSDSKSRTGSIDQNNRNQEVTHSTASDKLSVNYKNNSSELLQNVREIETKLTTLTNSLSPSPSPPPVRHNDSLDDNEFSDERRPPHATLSKQNNKSLDFSGTTVESYPDFSRSEPEMSSLDKRNVVRKKTLSLKKLMNENNRKFHENIETLKRNLSRYKTSKQ